MRWVPVPHPVRDGEAHPDGYVFHWGLGALRAMSRDPRLPRGPLVALGGLWRRGPDGQVEWMDVEALACMVGATLARVADGKPVRLEWPDRQVTEWLDGYCQEAGVYAGLVRLARGLFEAADAAGLLMREEAEGGGGGRPSPADTTSGSGTGVSAGSTS